MDPLPAPAPTPPTPSHPSPLAMRLACPCSSASVRTGGLILCRGANCTRRGGTVWGTNPFTTDSALCDAARFAGLIGLAGGLFVLRPAPRMTNYPGGMEQNGVRVQPWLSGWDAMVLSPGEPELERLEREARSLEDARRAAFWEAMEAGSRADAAAAAAEAAAALERAASPPLDAWVARAEEGVAVYVDTAVMRSVQPLGSLLASRDACPSSTLEPCWVTRREGGAVELLTRHRRAVYAAAQLCSLEYRGQTELLLCWPSCARELLAFASVEQRWVLAAALRAAQEPASPLAMLPDPVLARCMHYCDLPTWVACTYTSRRLYWLCSAQRERRTPRYAMRARFNGPLFEVVFRIDVTGFVNQPELMLMVNTGVAAWTQRVVAPTAFGLWTLDEDRVASMSRTSPVHVQLVSAATSQVLCSSHYTPPQPTWKGDIALRSTMPLRVGEACTLHASRPVPVGDDTLRVCFVRPSQGTVIAIKPAIVHAGGLQLVLNQLPLAPATEYWCGVCVGGEPTSDVPVAVLHMLARVVTEPQSPLIIVQQGPGFVVCRSRIGGVGVWAGVYFAEGPCDLYLPGAYAWIPSPDLEFRLTVLPSLSRSRRELLQVRVMDGNGAPLARSEAFVEQ